MLTVGVPVYNGVRFIDRCLACLSAEQFDYRVLIADNASTDGTEEIARDYAARDPRIIYHRHDENKGGVYNFIYLLEKADTEFFAWRAYDDLSTPGYFEQLTQALIDAPDRNLAVGSVTFDDSDGNPPPDPRAPNQLPDNFADRRRALVKCCSAAWIYGVFRREELTKRYLQVHDHYQYLWGIDTLSLLPFVISGAIQTVPDVYFKEYLSGASADAYRTKGVIKATHMVYQYCQYGFRCVDELTDNKLERLAMYRDVVRYANGRSEKFKRIAKRAVFWPYYRATGRL